MRLLVYALVESVLLLDERLEVAQVKLELIEADELGLGVGDCLELDADSLVFPD